MTHFFVDWKYKGAGQRLGQFFVNQQVLKGDLPWPDLYYETDNARAVDLIDSYIQALYYRGNLWKEAVVRSSYDSDEYSEQETWQSDFLFMAKKELESFIENKKAFLFEEPFGDYVAVLGLDELPFLLKNFWVRKPRGLRLPDCKLQQFLKKPNPNTASQVAYGFKETPHFHPRVACTS